VYNSGHNSVVRSFVHLSWVINWLFLLPGNRTAYVMKSECDYGCSWAQHDDVKVLNIDNVSWDYFCKWCSFYLECGYSSRISVCPLTGLVKWHVVESLFYCWYNPPCDIIQLARITLWCNVVYLGNSWLHNCDVHVMHHDYINVM